ncbi:hypothetical protein EMCRGX_G024210 [Ephydatia muelleri]
MCSCQDVIMSGECIIQVMDEMPRRYLSDKHIRCPVSPCTVPAILLHFSQLLRPPFVLPLVASALCSRANSTDCSLRRNWWSCWLLMEALNIESGYETTAAKESMKDDNIV